MSSRRHAARPRRDANNESGGVFDDRSCAVVREDALRRVQELKAERMSVQRSLRRFLVVADENNRFVVGM